MRVKYISVQPRTLYYAWQVEVMIQNFIKNGINPNDIEILVACSPNPQDLTNMPQSIQLWEKLSNNYNYVRFFYYTENREKSHYISSVRPNVLKQHFIAYPNLKNDAIFYHDCDMIFTQTPDFSKFLNDDVWYVSDTISYIGHDYIVSKGEDIYNTMCDIVGLHPSIPKNHQNNSGGAQYLMKNVTFQFWDKVEKDSEKLYTDITRLNNIKLSEDPSYHTLQIWCADMWAVLWNAWYYGNRVLVDPYLDFCWPTDLIENNWDKKILYHNAGVVGPGNLFFKGDYINGLPYSTPNTYAQNYCSYKYFSEIEETASKTVLI